MADPFRTTSLSCPRCPTTLSTGELGACARCEGVWIPEPALRERVSRMQERPTANLAWTLESRTRLPCAACKEPMLALSLYGIAIDRCVSHGLWFDRDELSAVLLASQHHALPVRGEPMPAVPQAPKPKTSSAKSLVGSGIDVIGGVLEVIGTLFSLL